MTISAIVCAFNEAHLLPACLFSLLAQTRPPDEIVVVDNASTDGTPEIARRFASLVFNRGPERSAQRIFKAADQILKAGTAETRVQS